MEVWWSGVRVCVSALGGGPFQPHPSLRTQPSESCTCRHSSRWRGMKGRWRSRCVRAQDFVSFFFSVVSVYFFVFSFSFCCQGFFWSFLGSFLIIYHHLIHTLFFPSCVTQVCDWRTWEGWVGSATWPHKWWKGRVWRWWGRAPHHHRWQLAGLSKCRSAMYVDLESLTLWATIDWV